MADHIPDPGKHRTLFYSYYANRVRGDRAAEEPGEGKVEEEPAKKRRGTASWARRSGGVGEGDLPRLGRGVQRVKHGRNHFSTEAHELEAGSEQLARRADDLV